MGSYTPPPGVLPAGSVSQAELDAAVNNILENQTHRLRTVLGIVDNTAVPPTEVDGDRYVLDDTIGTTHANWDGASKLSIVQFNGTSSLWEETLPIEGYVVLDDTANADIEYIDDGAPAWQARPVGSHTHTHASATGQTTDDHHAQVHDLGGSDHNTATLAQLNAKVSDATLIDTADSRLSDARTPTAHNLGGAEHNADTLANLNLKVSDAELFDENMARVAGSTFSTYQHMQDIFHSSGHSSGGVITDAGGNTIDVTAGTGFIRATDDVLAEIKFFDWGASLALSVPLDTTRYIIVEWNAGTPQVVVRTVDDTDRTTDFLLGACVNEGGTIHIHEAPHSVGDHANQMIQRTHETAGVQRDSHTGGLIIGETGTRNISMTTGAIWDRLRRKTIAALDTSITGSFDAFYRDGIGGWTKVATQTTWNNTQWDDGDGGLATHATNKYGVQWFYLEVDGHVIMVYGRGTYNNQALAETEAAPSNTPPRISTGGILLGRVVYQESAASALSVDTAFQTTFSITAGTAHGDLSGVTSDQHHAQLHSASHDAGGGDEINVETLGENTGNTGYLLTNDGDGTVSWQPSAAGAPEGTAVLSTGEVGAVKFLREDGDNTSSWQAVPAPTHASTTGQTTDDHHAQLHASAHSAGGGDEVNVENLGSGGATAGQLLTDDGDGTVSWNTKYVRTLIPIWQHTGATLGGGTTTFAIPGGGPGAISSVAEDTKIRVPKGRAIAITSKQDGGNSDATLSIYKNEVITALTGTATTAGGFAEIHMTTGGPVTFAEGDYLSVEILTTAGSGMTFRGMWVLYEVEIV